MAPTYRTSKGKTAFAVGFSLLWFGLVFGNAIINVLPEEESTPWRLAGAVVALLFALAPALLVAWMPYEVTVGANGECDVRSLLRRRRVRAEQIRSIAWDDEGGMCIRYERGKIRIPANDECKALAFHLAALNPVIKIDGEFTNIS